MQILLGPTELTCPLVNERSQIPLGTIVGVKAEEEWSDVAHSLTSFLPPS